jgi:hypothetical protein
MNICVLAAALSAGAAAALLAACAASWPIGKLNRPDAIAVG